MAGTYPLALNNLAVADPNVEGSSRLSSGMGAGSCAPGIGISQRDTSVTANEFDLVATQPQTSSNIGWGGDNAVTGQTSSDLPQLKVVDYATPDFNNVIGLQKADNNAAAGSAINSASGYINSTGSATTTDTWLWGIGLVV